MTANGSLGLTANCEIILVTSWLKCMTLSWNKYLNIYF